MSSDRRIVGLHLSDEFHRSHMFPIVESLFNDSMFEWWHNYGTFALCSCLLSFTGDRCQFINRCFANSPCLFGGTCISVMDSFSCQCPAGRTGTTCQLLSDNPCAGIHQCLNGGTCQLLSGTSQAACSCSANFTGDKCQTGLPSNCHCSLTNTFDFSCH
jgi:hypothetical protein